MTDAPEGGVVARKRVRKPVAQPPFSLNPDFDITAKVGPLWPLPLGAKGGDTPAIPMHSYARPAYMLWNAIGKALHEKGWTEEAIERWLRSRDTRWALDGSLGDAIEALGKAYADEMIVLSSLPA